MLMIQSKDIALVILMKLFIARLLTLTFIDLMTLIIVRSLKILSSK